LGDRNTAGSECRKRSGPYTNNPSRGSSMNLPIRSDVNETRITKFHPNIDFADVSSPEVNKSGSAFGRETAVYQPSNREQMDCTSRFVPSGPTSHPRESRTYVPTGAWQLKPAHKLLICRSLPGRLFWKRSISMDNAGACWRIGCLEDLLPGREIEQATVAKAATALLHLWAASNQRPLLWCSLQAKSRLSEAAR
jgi:hypothetical protein